MTSTPDATRAPVSPGPSVVQIPLRARGGELRGYALVDAVDAPKVAEHRWFMNNQGYAARNVPAGDGKQKTVLMARVIMDLQPGDPLEVDHISRDKLDNRRCNLRVGTHAQNSQNRVRRGGTSRYRGVSWRKDRKKWHAYGMLAGKMKHVGFFEDEEEAAAAAAAWRRENLPFSEDARAGA